MLGIQTKDDRMPITRTPCEDLDMEAASSAEEAPLAASPHLLNHAGPSDLSLPRSPQNNISISSPSVSVTSSKKCCSKTNNKPENLLSPSCTNRGDIDCGSTNYGERESIMDKM